MINYYLYNNNLLSEKITHDDEVFQIQLNDKYFHEKILDI